MLAADSSPLPSEDYNRGYQRAQLDTLAADMEEVKGAVKRIETTLAERAGERRAGLWLASTASAFVGAALALVARHLGVGN